MNLDNDNDKKVIKGIDVYSRIIDNAPNSLKELYQRTHPNKPIKEQPSDLIEEEPEQDLEDKEEKNGNKSVALILTAGLITLNSILSNGWAIGDDFYKGLKDDDGKENKTRIEEMEPEWTREYVGDTFVLNGDKVVVPLVPKEDKEQGLAVCWLNDEDLYIELNGTSEVINVNEAQEKYKDNAAIQAKIDDLLELQKNRTLLQIYPNINEINIEQIKAEIDAKIDEIIADLQLLRTDDPLLQLRNCCLVEKYIIEHNHYNNRIMFEKSLYPEEYMNILDLYNAVVLGQSVCTSNATMFKEILKRVGVPAEVICLTSTMGDGDHASNIVQIDGEWSFFDSTLDSSIYENQKQVSGGTPDVILCCAGLGMKDYSQYYTPLLVLPDDLTCGGVLPLPDGIMQDSIPINVVNTVITDDFLAYMQSQGLPQVTPPLNQEPGLVSMKSN